MTVTIKSKAQRCAELAYMYRPSDGPMMIIATCFDTYFLADDTETGEQYEIDYDIVDTKKDTFYQLKAITDSDI